MPRPSHTHAAAESVPHSLILANGGWHCSHFYYTFFSPTLARLTGRRVRARFKKWFFEALDPAGLDAPLRMQTSIVSGQKADFGLMMLDPDPLKINRVHQRLMHGPFGAILVPAYSFVSITEISEYVQSPEQFGERLVAEGMDTASDEYAARVKGYADRLEGMNRQRLTPDLPPYPAMCFYPMNKIREPHANWFMLPKEERSRLMIDHAKSGMAFVGKVSQLITVGVGLEDWEWGVTLWAANPEYLKDIVYRMRFDEASACYAQFGSFFTGYLATPAEILEHCQIAR